MTRRFLLMIIITSAFFLSSCACNNGIDSTFNDGFSDLSFFGCSTCRTGCGN